MYSIILKTLNTLRVVAASICTLFVAIIAVFAFLFSHHLGYWVQRQFGKVWVTIMGINLTVICEDKILPSSGIIAPNHSSWLDIPVLASLPWNLKWISKKEVKRIPFVGLAMQAGGFYFVSRDRSGKDASVMREVEEGLLRKETIVIFPEGTRSKSGELLPLKKGAFRVALATKVPMYPVAISGTFAESRAKAPSPWRHPVTVRVGQAFIPSNDIPIEQTMNIFQDRLQALLEQNQKEVPST